MKCHVSDVRWKKSSNLFCSGQLPFMLQFYIFIISIVLTVFEILEIYFCLFFPVLFLLLLFLFLIFLLLFFFSFHLLFLFSSSFFSSSSSFTFFYYFFLSLFLFLMHMWLCLGLSPDSVIRVLLVLKVLKGSHMVPRIKG